MFKKNLTLIFLAIVFLSFDNQTKTMQESKSTSAIDAEIEQSILHCEQESRNTLKFLATSKFIEILKAQGYTLSKENLQKIALPEDIIEYCLQCSILPLISKYIISLEQLKECKHLKITDENLYICKKLLLQLPLYIDIQDINLEEILSAIDDNFKSTTEYYNKSQTTINHITLEDINILLKSISIEYAQFSEQEKISLHKMICNFRRPCTDLFKLLAKTRLSSHDWEGFFSMRDNDGRTILHYAANEEKKYNCKSLFNIRPNRTKLHYAGGRTNNLEVILELMKEKELKLDDFINIRCHIGMTPLMIAASKGNDESVQLLINHGANINISNKGKTALYYAIQRKRILLKYRILFKYNENTTDPEIENIDRCIEVLTPKRTCILQ